MVTLQKNSPEEKLQCPKDYPLQRILYLGHSLRSFLQPNNVRQFMTFILKIEKA